MYLVNSEKTTFTLRERNLSNNFQTAIRYLPTIIGWHNCLKQAAYKAIVVTINLAMITMVL